MNSQIEQAIKYRDNYRDFLAALPAFIYNNNIEIFQANLEQMNQEIDRMIEEADDLHARNAAVEAQERDAADLGTRVIISGGEVLELDAWKGGDDLPF